VTTRHHPEIPPTAGLPLRISDLWPARPTLAATLAEQLDLPEPLLECSGTAALLVALRTLSQQAPQRRMVVVPAYTCPLVAIAVHSLGLELRLCDTRPGHFEMDPQALAPICGSDTLAIVPAHLGGLVADLDGVLDVAKDCGARVIEDAAQAMGARDREQSVGLRGDIGFFSLAAGKGLSIYEGGLLMARDPELRAALARTHAAMVPRRRGWELRRSLELLGLALLYRPAGLGLAYGGPLRRALRRGDAVAAVGDAFPPTIPLHRVGCWRQGVGTRAAARLPAFLQQLRAQAAQRLAELQRIPSVRVLEPAPGTEGSWPFFMLQMSEAARCEAALAELWPAGLGVSRLFVHALPDYAYLADRVPQTPMPNARDFAARTLTVSNSPWLDAAAFERIRIVLRQAAR
jgi:dTDP-4-amino-4,6-dideoxygalactose transaminase